MAGFALPSLTLDRFTGESKLTYMEKEYYVGDKPYAEVRFGLYAQVEVVGKRSPYGRLLYLIRPVSGVGRSEVESSSLMSEEKAEELAK